MFIQLSSKQVKKGNTQPVCFFTPKESEDGEDMFTPLGGRIVLKAGATAFDAGASISIVNSAGDVFATAAIDFTSTDDKYSNFVVASMTTESQPNEALYLKISADSTVGDGTAEVFIYGVEERVGNRPKGLKPPKYV